MDFLKPIHCFCHFCFRFLALFTIFTFHQTLIGFGEVLVCFLSSILIHPFRMPYTLWMSAENWQKSFHSFGRECKLKLNRTKRKPSKLIEYCTSPSLKISEQDAPNGNQFSWVENKENQNFEPWDVQKFVTNFAEKKT